MPLLNIPSNPPIESTTDSCALCHDPLLIPSTEAIGASHIIDDVELRCGHHFHWACIMDYSKVNKKAREECALCRASTLDAHGRFIVSIRNEGGMTGGFDLGEEIDEQAYLDAHPEVRRKELFLSLMSQMDFSDAEKLLKGEDLDEDEEEAAAILATGASKKMDPNVTYDSGGLTAMHMAALNDDAEGVELLLRYGADKNIKTESGQTALELAIEENAKSVIALLSP